MIKHSKFKNTGLLFELLVRQATSDLMSNKMPEAVRIFKKYFTNTELSKEYNLYTSVINAPKLTEGKADILISTIVEQASRLDKEKLSKEKYNLIREIKKHYDLDNFFKAKIEAYKIHAAVYTLLESQVAKEFTNTQQLMSNKLTLLEHITQENTSEKDKTPTVAEDFLKEDKEIRLLAYKFLVEKFNEKYADLSQEQKEILKEYINNISDTKQLKNFLNSRLEAVKTELTNLSKTVEDDVIRIKLAEVLTFIKPIGARESVKDDVIVGLMQYYQLINEIKSVK
jgi:hypothetical protein